MSLPRGEIIRKGAEAILIKGPWFDQEEALYKVRVKKTYRIRAIDEKLRLERTVMEARILGALFEAGIPVPTLLDVDAREGVIVMEFVRGPRIKDILQELHDKIGIIFEKIGQEVARIHDLGIIHGDLTTSNILYESPIDADEIAFRIIDFGLARHSTSIEDKSVDLHLFKRVITSTHASLFDEIFPQFMTGYGDFMESRGKTSDFDKITTRLAQIETRGRYVEKSKRL
ncbi:MAG TPA: Kae1-associated kinase Bud32 [Candidatus Lokiarchaeia archaeon]|nr:Kae1-associated kinase Bud32 [Candidatus Lokiarchaeia archaeon]